MKQAQILLFSPLVYSAILNIETKCSSETSVDCQRTTQRYITEDSAVDQEHCVYSQNIFFYLHCGWSAV